MLSKLARNIAKLYHLLAAGEYTKVINAAKLRVDRLLYGNRNDLRTEVELHERELSRVLRKHFSCNNDYRSGTTKIALILRGGGLMPQSSAFIRLIAPLTHPSVHDAFSIKLHPENTTNIDSEADICIVQRTAIDKLRPAKQLVKNLRRDNVKLVLDTDDAFSMLENNHSQYREQAGRVKAMRYILEQADQAWISTEILSGLYGNPDHHFVVRNTLDERIWQTNNSKRRIPANSKKPLQLVCMGTATHNDDLEMIMPALDEVASNHSGSFELTLIGVTDDIIDRPWLKRIRQPKFGAMYPNFVQWFMKQGPFDIGLSPLRDTEFNRSKSDIKCLDYLAAGVVPIVSDVTPYQGEVSPHIIKVPNTHDQWAHYLKKQISHPQKFRRKRNELTRQAQQYIWQHRSSKQTAQALKDNLALLER